MPNRSRPIIDRARERVTVNLDTGCWEWTGATNHDGYGVIAPQRQRKKQVKVHRVFYTAYNGPIPDGLELDHLCRNPRCVSPAHCEPVTHAENMRRGNRVGPQKTHCPQGHPYSPDNTRVEIGPKGQRRRHCITCHRNSAK